MRHRPVRDAERPAVRTEPAAIRSDTIRFIRSSSSSTRATVELTSAGSLGSSTSRCPRMIVIGVCNSWPASSTNRRWAATPVSTRSSMPLTVATRSSSSSPSPPRRGIRCDRSVSVMVRAVSVISRSGRRMRPATSQAAPTAPNRVTAPTISMSRRPRRRRCVLHRPGRPRRSRRAQDHPSTSPVPRRRRSRRAGDVDRFPGLDL